MRILALEPYYGGSHRAFLDGWIARSRHEWTLLTLPAFKWKWRMRHSAVTFARQMHERTQRGERWDLVFCSSMLNLAEFLGLAPAALRDVPVVAYFHENQLTYPVQVEAERDYHFGYTNMTTALAARRVWFNSAFNRDSFLEALPAFLKRMPDFQPFDAVEQIRERSEIQPPGVEPFPPRGPRQPGPLRILWAARWEHDKQPELFFAALRLLRQAGVEFRVSVLGERFRRVPAVFAQARQEFSGLIDRWGYQERREDYEGALRAADVFVSTAAHEFFGLSVVEAIAAGAVPLLPARLSYPEILADCPPQRREDFFYDGSVTELVARLRDLAQRCEQDDLWRGDPQCGVRAVGRFSWERRAPDLDAGLEATAMYGPDVQRHRGIDRAPWRRAHN